MSVHLFQYPLQEIEISQSMVAQLMGYPEEAVPTEITSIIESEIARFPETDEIQGGYTIIPCDLDHNKHTVSINSQEFYLGKKLMHMMKHSARMAIFTCTAGNYISNRAKELMGAGEVLEGYIVDVLGSTLVEKAMDKIQASLKAEMKQSGQKITNRYSPGYCDWVVAEQKKLFALLPEGFCGISLSESALMHPIKSVSGFIGIGDKVKKHAHTCDMCTATRCIYRNMNPEKSGQSA